LVVTPLFTLRQLLDILLNTPAPFCSAHWLLRLFLPISLRRFVPFTLAALLFAIRRLGWLVLLARAVRVDIGLVPRLIRDELPIGNIVWQCRPDFYCRLFL
jgi:hypothetical protein